MEWAITQAARDADQAGVQGKALTPYLLARVSELTEGRSQAANLALLENNARVGAALARALAGAPAAALP
jgi:pseudouridine-5'-phosphate glycosidase